MSTDQIIQVSTIHINVDTFQAYSEQVQQFYINQIRQDANNYQSNGNSKEQIVCLKNLLHLLQNFNENLQQKQFIQDITNINFELGNCFLKQINIEQALLHFNESIQTSQNSIEIILQIEAELTKKSLFIEIIDILKKELKKKCDSELYFRLGQAYQQLNKLNDAQECFEECIRLDPLNIEYNKNNKIVQSQLIDQLLIKYQKSLETNRDNYDLNLMVGKLAKCQQLNSLAQEKLLKCINLDQKRNEAFHELSDISLQNDIKQAKEYLKQSINVNESCIITFFKLGVLNIINKKYVNSLKYLLKSLYTTISQKSGIDLQKISERIMNEIPYQYYKNEEDALNSVNIPKKINTNQNKKINRKDTQYKQEQLNKSFEIILDLKVIKDQYLKELKNIFRYSQQAEFFFLNFGLILIINILVDKIIQNEFQNKQTKKKQQDKAYERERNTKNKQNKLNLFIEQDLEDDDNYINSNINQYQDKQQRNKQKQQQQKIKQIQGQVIVKFKDQLSCLGVNKDLFESLLCLSFKLKNEYEQFMLLNKNRKQFKSELDQDIIHLNRILDCKNDNFTYSGILNSCFIDFQLGNFKKVSQKLLQFIDIKNLFYCLISEMPIYENNIVIKQDFLMQCLELDPLYQLSIQKLLQIQNYLQKIGQSNSYIPQKMKESLYQGFINKQKDYYQELQTVENQSIIYQRFRKLMINIQSQKKGQIDVKEAIKILMQYIQQDNNDYFSYFLLGNFCLQAQQFVDAKEYFYQSILLNPTNEKCFYQYAIVLNKLENIENSIEYLKESYKLIGLDDIIIESLCIYCIKLDFWFIFNEYYKENYSYFHLEVLIRNLNEKNIKSFTESMIKSQSQSTIDQILSRPKEIQEYYNCISYKRNHQNCKGLCFYNKSKYYESKKQLKKAIHFMRKCIDINTDLYKLSYLQLIVQNKNFQESNYELNSMLKDDPLNTSSHYLLGKSYYALGQYQKCIQYFLNLKKQFEIESLDIIKIIISSYLQIGLLNKEVGKNYKWIEDKIIFIGNSKKLTENKYQQPSKNNQNNKQEDSSQKQNNDINTKENNNDNNINSSNNQIDISENALEYLQKNLNKEFQDEEMITLQFILKVMITIDAYANYQQEQNLCDKFEFLLYQSYLKINNMKKAIEALKSLKSSDLKFASLCKIGNVCKFKQIRNLMEKEKYIFSLDMKRNDINLDQNFSESSQLQKSINYLQTCTKKDPIRFEPYFILSQIFEEQGDYKKQLKILKSLFSLNPQYKCINDKIQDILSKQGEQYYRNKDYYNAMSCFQQFIQTKFLVEDNYEHKECSNKIKDIYFKISICYQQILQPENAINLLQETLILYPDMIECLFQLAILKFEQKEFQKSQESLDKLLLINPTHANALFYAGQIQYILKNYNQSFQFFEKCVNICDKIKGIYLWLALVYKKLKEYDNVVACLKVSQEIELKTPEQDLQIAYLQYKLKNYHEAIPILKKLADSCYNCSKLQNCLAECYFHIGNFNDGYIILSKLKLTDKMEIRLYLILYKLKKLSKIEEILNKQDDKAAELHYNIAFMLFEQRINYDEILDHINECLKINPYHQQCLTLQSSYNLNIEKNMEVDLNLIIGQEVDIKTLNIQELLLASKYFYIQSEYRRCQIYLEEVFQLNFSNEDAIYLQGMIYFQQNKKQNCLNELKKNKYHYKSLSQIGKILEKDREFNQAKEYFFKALQIRKYRHKNIIHIANIESEQKNYQKAIDYYQSYLKLSKQFDSKVYTSIATSQINLKQYDKAIQTLKHSISIKPDQQYAFQLIGECQSNLNNNLEAEEAFLESYKLNKKNYDSSFYLGNIYKQNKNFEKAKFFYNQCLAEKKNHSQCMNNLGEVLYKEGKYKDALQYFIKSSNLDKGNLTCLVNQAKIFWKVDKNYVVSIDILNRIISSDKNNFKCISYLLKVCIRAKKKDKVQELYEAHRDKLIQNEKLLIEISELYYAEKEYFELAQLFEKTLEQNHNSTILLIVAKCYYISKNFLKFEKIFEKYNSEMNKNNFDYHFLQAMLLIYKGKTKKIIYHLRYCMEIDPQNEMVYYFQSLFHLKKNTERAQKLFDQGFSTNPDNTSEIKVILQGILCEVNGKTEECEKILLEYSNSNKSEFCQYRLGYFYFKQKRYEDAINIFEQLNLLDSQFLSSIYCKPLSQTEIQEYKLSLAISYQKTKNILKALQIIADYLIVNPNCSQALKLNAELFYEQGKVTQAVFNIQKYIEIHPNSDESYFFLGQVQLKQDKFNQALYFFKKCININPQYPNANLKLADAYLSDLQFQNALQYYNKHLTIDKNNIQIMQLVVLILINLEQYQDAHNKINDIIQIYPDNSQNFCLQGLNYKKQRMIDESIQSYEISIKLDPNNMDTLKLMALSYSEKGDTKNEKKIYKCILKQNPENLQSLNNIGNIYLTQNKIDQAIEQYTKCIQLDKYRTEYYSNLGKCYYQKQQYKDAIKQFEEGLIIDCQNLDCIYNLAIAYIAIGNIIQATQELLLAIRINPNFIHGYYHLAKLFKRQGKIAEAIQFFKQCLEKDKLNLKCQVKLAICLKEQKEYTQAKIHLKECLAIDKNNSEALFQLAMVYREEQNYSQSLHYLTNLNKLHPKNTKFIHNIGITYNLQKNYKEALKYMLQSIELEDNNETYWYNLGEIYHNLKMYDDEINPNLIKYYNNLGIAYSYINKTEEAIDCFMKYHQFYPKDENCLYNIGNQYLIKEDFETAIKYYEQCLQINQQHIDCLNNYGFALIKQKKYLQAYIMFQRCQFVSPKEEKYKQKCNLLRKMI